MNSILLANSTSVITDLRQITHIRQVLQAKVGDSLKIAVQDGKLGHAVIAGIDERAVYLRDMVLDTPPPAKLPLTVVLALPRPKVLRRLMIDMTAIGVAHIVLMNSYRTDKSYWQSPQLLRLHDFIQEGLEQGVDSIAPQLTLAKRFKPFIQDELPKFDTPIMLAHPYSDLLINDYTPTPKTLIIGAEGGFIDYEVKLMQESGAVAVSLGRRILRTESAVSALLGRFM